MNENESWNGWKLYCYMCGHFWTVRNDKPPRTCPWCRSSRYDTPIKGSTNVPTAGTSGLSDRSQTSAPNADMPSACSPIPRYATAPQTLDLFEKYGVFGFLEEPALQWQSIDNTVLDINEYIGAGAFANSSRLTEIEVHCSHFSSFEAAFPNVDLDKVTLYASDDVMKSWNSYNVEPLEEKPEEDDGRLLLCVEIGLVVMFVIIGFVSLRMRTRSD